MLPYGYIFMETKLDFQWNVLCEASFWNRGTRQFGNRLYFSLCIYLRVGALHPTPEKFGNSFISTFRPTAHTNPSRKWSFPKTLFKPEEIENAGFAFSCGRKTFWKRGFSKTMTSRWPRDFPDGVSHTNPKCWWKTLGSVKAPFVGKLFQQTAVIISICVCRLMLILTN